MCEKQGGVRRLWFLEHTTRTRSVLPSLPPALYIMSGIILVLYSQALFPSRLVPEPFFSPKTATHKFLHCGTNTSPVDEELQTCPLESQRTPEGHYEGKMRTFSPRHQDYEGVFFLHLHVTESGMI